MAACIFARFTRKMHGDDNMLESGCGIQKTDAAHKKSELAYLA